MATSRAQTSSGRKRPYAPRLPPAERREQLLDAALDLIAEDGYRGVSMEAIARRAGVTKPVVYDLFSNRGELLMALLEREEENALALLAEVMPSAPSVDPDELIVEGFRAFLESVATNPTTWRLIVLPADGTPEVVRQHVEAGRATVRARLADLLRWGLKARGGPKGVDTELAAQALEALGEHFARLVITDPEGYPPQRLGDFVAGVLSVIERPGPAAK
jgi:AcrR family transcriptional regulator